MHISRCNYRLIIFLTQLYYLLIDILQIFHAVYSVLFRIIYQVLIVAHRLYLQIIKEVYYSSYLFIRLSIKDSTV